ncbi:MAG: class B sortase [Lachnospiraceae bacterium]|nr:class B sortase [Lachnospiraceae bacterium]
MSDVKSDNKSNNSKKKNKKRNRIIYNILLCVFICIFIGCAIYLISYFMESKKSEDTVDGLKDMVIDESQDEEIVFDSMYPEVVVATETDAGVVEEIKYINFDGTLVQKKYARLYKYNPDFVGWIKIEDTDIDYPVMQSMYEEEYYIYRDYDKQSSSAGTLFVDTSSDIVMSDNILIYGHNMHTGKMFHDLLEYEDEEFYKNHKTFTFNTIHGDGTYQVIAAFRTRIYEVDYTGFKYYQFFDAANEEEFMDYVKNCVSMTPYTIENDVEYGDKLLTLSTCAYHTTNGRFVVVAKKIEE